MDLHLNVDGAGGKCVYDSIGVFNSPDGPGGRLCGIKSGYSVLTRAPSQDEDLKLSILAQGVKVESVLNIVFRIFEDAMQSILHARTNPSHLHLL